MKQISIIGAGFAALSAARKLQEDMESSLSPLGDRLNPQPGADGRIISPLRKTGCFSRSGESVTHPDFCKQEVRAGRVLFQFVPQDAHINAQIVGAIHVVWPPYFLQQQTMR